jgi:hypothetical protein
MPPLLVVLTGRDGCRTHAAAVARPGLLPAYQLRDLRFLLVHMLLGSPASDTGGPSRCRDGKQSWLPHNRSANPHRGVLRELQRRRGRGVCWPLVYT